MSDATPEPTPAPKPAKKPKIKKPGRWRRRLIWTLSILIVLGFAVRALVPLALPTVLQKVAGMFGLTCTYDHLELNVFSGDAGIWGIKVLPKEGGPAILETEYCHGNLSVMDLLRGKLNVWRAEADGVDVNLDRDADGHIPLLDRFVSSTATTAKTPTPVTPTSTKSQPIDLSSPLRLDALRLGHIRVHIHDRGITPEVDTELAMDLRLSDLGSSTSPAKFEMNLSADPLLDSLKVTGEGTSGGKKLDAKFNVVCRGIRPKSAAGYLQPLGIVAVGDAITLRAAGAVHTAPALANADGFTGSLTFDHLSASVDGVEAMALDKLTLTADTIDSKSIHLGKLLLEGIRANAGRGPDGNLRALGVEYNPAVIGTQPAPAPAPVVAAAPTNPAGPPAIVASLLAEPWSLGEAAIHNAAITLHDEGVSPAVNLSLVADELSAKNIDHDPQNLNTTVTLTGLLHAAGVIRDVKLTGTAHPFAEKKTLEAAVAVTGIKPDAIAPYLDQIGLESDLKDGAFTTGLDASLTIADNGDLSADAKIGKVLFKDDTDLISLNGVTLSGMTLAPKTGKIGMKSIEISGPGISAGRQKSGEFAALGFHTIPREAAKSAKAAEKVTVATVATVKTAVKEIPHPVLSQSTTIGALPQITVGSLVWKDIHVNLRDDMAEPPVTLTMSDVGVELKNLTTELNADGKAKPGHIHAWLAAADIAKRLDFAGDLSPRATGLDFDANVTGAGITLAGLTPYLKSFGIEPTLRDGSLALHAKASIDQTDDKKLTASLVTDHVSYRDGNTELAGVDEVAVKNVALVNSELDVDAVQVTRPRAIAKRNADNSLEAGGIRLVKATPITNDTTAPVATPSASPAPTVAAASTNTPASVAPAKPFVVVVKKVAVEDSSITWTDAAVQPNVNITSGASVHVDNFVFGRPAEPATLNVTAHADGVIDSATVNGKLAVGVDAQSVQLDVSAAGIRAGQLAAYLPPGLQSSLKDGRFHSSVDAELSKNAAGGLAASLVIGASDFRDGPADPALFKMDSVRVIVPRIDLPDTALAVDEISATGVETHAEKAGDGTIQLLGLVLGGKNATADAGAPPATVPVAASQPVADVTHGPDARVTVAPPATEPATSIADLLAAAHKTLPLITVDKLDLNLSKLSLADLSRPESQPLVVSDLHLKNVNRIEWLGKDAGGKPPTHLQLSCQVAPMIDHVQVDTLVAPFARHPTVQVDFAATGVRGDGLTGLVPELKPKLDGSDLTNGSLTAHFEAEAKLDRRSPIDFDLSHGFDLSFLLDKVYYRAAPDGPVLMGVDEVQSENIRIQPKESIVHVKTLEITKPIGLISQDEAGIHALGWVLKLPKPEPEGPSTQPAVAIKKESSTQPVVTAAPATTPPVKPNGEVRIDKLLISGLDAQFNDYAVTPPMMIPLNGLEVEVKNLSTLDQFEDRPIRFSALVNAGKVKLKKRPKPGGGIGSLLGGIVPGKKPAEKPTEPETEERDLFAQITANGEVSLYPQIHGWAKTSVSGLDLAALEGAAHQAGVNLSNGLYDSEVDVKFNPDGSVATDSRFVLTDLSLTEGPNGPIAKALNLPMPLDGAIGVVQDADGSIVFPLKVALQPSDISYTAVAVAAMNGVGQVVVNAVASSPMKAAGDVTAVFGFGGTKKAAQSNTVTIPFKAGSVAFDSTTQQALTALIEQLKNDPSLTATVTHQLGAGDVTRAAERANPSPEQCDALQQQLRLRKVELLNLRADTAGRARAQLMSLGTAGAQSAMQQLAAIDRELAGTEDSLDQVCDLLRPGAEKQAERRTRTASLKIAALRLSEIKAALLASGLPNIADRVKIIPPRFDPSTDQDAVVTITTVQKK